MADATFSLPAGLPADPALFSTLLDLLPMGVIYYTPVVDAMGTLTDLALAYLNPAAQRLARLPAQPGTTYRQQFPSTDANGVWEFHRRSWLAREPAQFQFYYDVDGFDSYFRVTAQRLGEGLLVVFADTCDEGRSQVEETLLASQAREQAARAAAEAQQAELRAVLEQAPVAISLLQGPAHVIEFANTRMAQLWGRPLAQVVGQPHFAALPELGGQGFEAVLDTVFRTGEPHYLLEQVVTLPRAGQPCQGYFNIVYQPSYNGQGQRTGVITSAIEVTEQVVARRQVEQLNQELERRVAERTQALADQQLLLSQIIGQVPAAIATLSGPAHRFSFFNDDYQTIVHQRAHLGQPVSEAIPEAGEQGFIDLLDRVYATGQPYVSRAVPVQLLAGPSGEMVQHYVDLSYQALRNERKQVTGILAFIVDVTQGVLAQQQVQHLNQALTATNKELLGLNTQLTRTNVDLDNFIYTASHDLKAPITNIEGLLLALEHELPEAGRTGDVPLMLTLMQDAIERFRRTIAHLTDLSRLQKEHTPANEAVPLAGVVEDVRLDLTPLLVQGQLTVSIPAGLTITFAEKNLRSVVYNLLSNAFKYRHPDRAPQVQLRSWQADDYAVLEVQDNGLGLDLAQGQQRLFAMFQRLHTHVEGTGVGLYMVKRIVENAGGRIEVTSELGQGSTFRVYFQQ
ncbi:ATP-binding protein [Hymenobacter sp. BT559]|uniref:sensor histidine kinase n=1 Tax=Hymenobacter sp. BT559 TaxID=2795729 RepID=UPI0018ED1D61|nr:ATP-binding protein [Hymenobacter sp. BT559]MBJ6146179.1 PAS domain-containing protein [Hymenobacter sp. BT559]